MGLWKVAGIGLGTIMAGALVGLTAQAQRAAPVPFEPSVRVTLVRVDKSERRLDLMAGHDVVRSYPIALGGNPVGHKQRQGDQRTPEGRYVLDWRNAQSGYYRSIHISYPNALDRADAASRGVDPGGDIMIHGQPNGYGLLGPILQLRDWTFGCIAVTNEHMAEIWDLVENGTPIEIRS